MNRRAVFTGLLLFLMGLTANAIAQSKGTIAGRVTDSSGAVLQGAHVELRPRGLAVSSNERGEFSITDVMPGSYKVLISYVGLGDFETDVMVEAGGMARVEARMEVASHVEDIIVVAE